MILPLISVPGVIAIETPVNVRIAYVDGNARDVWLRFIEPHRGSDVRSGQDVGDLEGAVLFLDKALMLAAGPFAALCLGHKKNVGLRSGFVSDLVVNMTANPVTATAA